MDVEQVDDFLRVQFTPNQQRHNLQTGFIRQRRQRLIQSLHSFGLLIAFGGRDAAVIKHRQQAFVEQKRKIWPNVLRRHKAHIGDFVQAFVNMVGQTPSGDRGKQAAKIGAVLMRAMIQDVALAAGLLAGILIAVHPLPKPTRCRHQQITPFSWLLQQLHQFRRIQRQHQLVDQGFGAFLVGQNCFDWRMERNFLTAGGSFDNRIHDGAALVGG